MSYIQKYIEYLKDNPKEYWFKRKLYGWGWTPAKWQGWVVVLIAVLLIAWNGVYFAELKNPTNENINWFLIRTAIIVGLLLLICFKKGEKPRWQWGPDKK